MGFEQKNLVDDLHSFPEDAGSLSPPPGVYQRSFYPWPIGLRSMSKSKLNKVKSKFKEKSTVKLENKVNS